MAVDIMQSSPTGCPPSEALASFLDRRMSPGDRAAMHVHLLVCAGCRAVLADAAAALAEVDDPPASSPPPPPRRSFWRRLSR